jgi:hypothetical protein
MRPARQERKLKMEEKRQPIEAQGRQAAALQRSTK